MYILHFGGWGDFLEDTTIRIFFMNTRRWCLDWRYNLACTINMNLLYGAISLSTLLFIVEIVNLRLSEPIR